MLCLFYPATAASCVCYWRSGGALADKIKSTSTHTEKISERIPFPDSDGHQGQADKARRGEGGCLRTVCKNMRLGSSVKGQLFGVNKNVLAAACRRTNPSAISPGALILDSQQN